MTDLGILANINNSDQVIQNEIICINFRCVKCGKFKDKRSTDPRCTVCLFGISTKEAIEKGFIHS
tara:strand:- start:422 stop:616 length:195 start_codon:yes stop_codon:yes gene_type:complete